MLKSILKRVVLTLIRLHTLNKNMQKHINPDRNYDELV